jgi:hypothetical protein
VESLPIVKRLIVAKKSKVPATAKCEGTLVVEKTIEVIYGDILMRGRECCHCGLPLGMPKCAH